MCNANPILAIANTIDFTADLNVAYGSGTSWLSMLLMSLTENAELFCNCQDRDAIVSLTQSVADAINMCADKSNLRKIHDMRDNFAPLIAELEYRIEGYKKGYIL